MLNTGQQLTVNGTGTTGTVKVQTGTVPLTLAIQPQSACPVGAVCKSDILDIEPHAAPTGQTLTAVFDTGKPSPFVLIPFVKFLIFKPGIGDQPLPLCRPYLKPQPLPGGQACEYFRWMNLQGHAIVYVALGHERPARPPVTRRVGGARQPAAVRVAGGVHTTARTPRRSRISRDSTVAASSSGRPCIRPTRSSTARVSAIS